MPNPNSPWYRDQFDPSIAEDELHDNRAPPASKLMGVVVTLIVALVLYGAFYGVSRWLLALVR